VPFIKDKISVIIATHNSLPLLENCLASLKKGLSSLVNEIIVVDNNSHDHSPTMTRQMMPEAVVLTNNKNTGFASACNQGASKATGEFLLFVNPDLEIDLDAVEYLKKVFTANEKAGAVTGRLRFGDGSFQPNCREFPTPGNLLYSRGSVLSRLLGQKPVYTLGDYKETTKVAAVSGTMLMIRNEVFYSTGRFDERFFMYMEDTDLCYRLHLADYDNYFCPDAGAVHNWGSGSSAGRFKRNLWHHGSVWKYFLKHFPNGFSVVVLPVILMFNFLLLLIFPSWQRKK